MHKAPILVLSLLALFLALSGAGAAATGGNLVLGKANNADATTTLAAPVAGGKALQLSNTNTAAGSTALGLNVVSGHPPLTVSSGAGKVANLNVDKLDGLEANRFWQLGGNTVDTTFTLGTANNHPLWFVVNGQKALRIVPNATSPILVGGFAGNSVDPAAAGATISGGGGPGNANTAYGVYSAVSGGAGNTSAAYSAVSGGSGNTASGPHAAIGGGLQNTASNDYSAIGGGQYNTASSDYSTVPGGSGNTASGLWSFAAGRQAQATDDGSFVWADNNSFDIGSYGYNTFTARTTGGARFVSAIDVNGTPTAGVALYSGNGSWSGLSDRAAKRGFAPVDRGRLLERLDRVPIARWSYKAQAPSIRHMGPMAQDFSAAFGLGEDNRHIDTVDADGVALAAIQGLYRQNQALRRQNRALNARLTKLERAVARLGH